VNAYGQWLGNRYKNYPNIIWQIGGDSNTPHISGLKQKMSDLATGLAAADPNHLITSEECPVGVCGVGSNSTLDIWGGASWVGLNSNYSQYGQTQSQCAAQYAKLSTYPTVPPFQAEDWYEGEHSMTELQLREEAYWEVLSGCYLGRFFGNNAIWTMGGPKNSMGTTWQAQLGSVGSVGQQYVGKLMNSREHWLMVPDTAHSVLTAGFGSGTAISVASRTSDGQTIIAYIPNGNATTVTINMAKITSSSSAANAWWYSPRTSTPTLLGTFSNSGLRNFTAPDSNDWVLVIDDASANLPAPGSGKVSTNPGVTNLACRFRFEDGFHHQLAGGIQHGYRDPCLMYMQPNILSVIHESAPFLDVDPNDQTYLIGAPFYNALTRRWVDWPVMGIVFNGSLIPCWKRAPCLSSFSDHTGDVSRQPFNARLSMRLSKLFDGQK